MQGQKGVGLRNIRLLITLDQQILFDLNQQKIMNIKTVSINIATSSPRQPRSLVLLGLLLVIMEQVNSLHIQAVVQDPKEYKQETYYSELSGMQVRFSNDLKVINEKFKGINLKLADTNISASDKVIFLQENLAEERDSLFNIQNYLNVPFALRSCQCINVTQKQKDDLQAQIQDVQASINALDKAIAVDNNGKPYENPNCPSGKCAAVESINNQIRQMNSYVKIMNDTITSECCKVVNYVYRDNLVSSNSWIYGNTNEKDYRLAIFNQSSKVNLTQCPESKPFANTSSNQCFTCPQDKPLLDLGTRQCSSSCQNRSLIYDVSQHQCDYNRTCEEDYYFNTTSNRCEVALGTDSSCPKDKPIWSVKGLICIPCPVEKPFFDIAVKACRKCTENEVWQEYTEICLDKTLILLNCSNGTYYDQITKNCEIIPNNTKNGPGNGKVGSGTPLNPSTNTSQNASNLNNGSSKTPTTGTYSQCPPATPFWSESDLACYKCPESIPYYNPNSKKCEQCPENTTWQASQVKCVKNPIECPANQTYNSVSQKCDSKVNCQTNQVFNSATGKCDSFRSTGQIGMCPPESPFWNAKTLYCEKCSQATPNWNEASQQCQVCPVYTEWDSTNQTCKSTIKQCPLGQVYNLQAARCVPIKCSTDSPAYNYATRKCQPCPEGTKYNNMTFICESTSPQRTNTSVCPAQTPYWNSEKLFCDVCPSGQSLNSDQKCQLSPVHFNAFPRHQLQFSIHESISKVEQQIHQKMGEKLGHLSSRRGLIM